MPASWRRGIAYLHRSSNTVARSPVMGKDDDDPDEDVDEDEVLVEAMACEGAGCVMCAMASERTNDDRSRSINSLHTHNNHTTQQQSYTT